jgi:coenzyme F420-reducing hydrogenase beta subunit
MSKVDDLELRVHGRSRELDSMVWGNNDAGTTNNIQDMIADESRFGVMYQPMTLARGIQMENAQWTGVVTSIALAMLESNQVDAVVCIASNNDSSSSSNSSSWSEPQTILAKTCDDVLRGRGVKPALAASLNVLDQIQADTSIRRLLFCGVGCAVQAFRAVQHRLDLDAVYVLGTNCADNSPTPQAARNFIQNGVQIKNDDSDDDTVLGYEFMQDYRVHVKTKNNYYKKPYFCLPGSIAKQSIAPSCLACFDYTNALADVVVGYMAAPLVGDNERMDASWQTLTVRNERGAKMVATATAAGRLDIGPVATGTGSHENIAVATTLSDFMVQSMINDDNVVDVGERHQGMPVWMGEILAFVLRTTGPKGVAFARYSIDYHVLRNYLHVLKEWGTDDKKKKNVDSSSSDEVAMITAATSRRLPRYARDIVEHYLTSNAKFRQAQDKIALSKHKKRQY